MHLKFYLDTMSIQMLHRQSIETQLCPHQPQGWAVTQGWMPQIPSNPQDSICTVRTNTRILCCCLPLTHLFDASYICFLMRQHLVTGKLQTPIP